MLVHARAEQTRDLAGFLRAAHRTRPPVALDEVRDRPRSRRETRDGSVAVDLEANPIALRFAIGATVLFGHVSTKIAPHVEPFPRGELRGFPRVERQRELLASVRDSDSELAAPRRRGGNSP